MPLWIWDSQFVKQYLSTVSYAMNMEGPMSINFMQIQQVLKELTMYFCVM